MAVYWNAYQANDKETIKALHKRYIALVIDRKPEVSTHNWTAMRKVCPYCDILMRLLKYFILV